MESSTANLLVLFRDFRSAGFDRHMFTTPSGWRPTRLLKVTSRAVESARRIGEQYGGVFVLPVTLALICREMRDPDLFRNGIDEFKGILGSSLA